jgi:exodeoxyribonuclease VII small subunit
MASEETSAPPSVPAVQALIENGSFEDVLATLEAVVAHLERGRLSIDDSVTWYELGMGLSRRSSELLHQAELRIATIEERFASDPHADDPWHEE